MHNTIQSIFILLTLCLAPVTSVHAQTNYYGGSQKLYGPQANQSQATCRRAVKKLPILEKRKQYFCRRDPSSAMCENYQGLYQSWSRIRQSSCGRTNKHPLF